MLGLSSSPNPAGLGFSEREKVPPPTPFSSGRREAKKPVDLLRCFIYL